MIPGHHTPKRAVACYVSVTARSTRVVDRGCFHNQATVNGLCNQIITETDGTQLHYFCCNESDFCNENTTVTFPSVSDGTTPPTTTPAIVTSPITTATSATTTDHDGWLDSQ